MMGWSYSLLIMVAYRRNVQHQPLVWQMYCNSWLLQPATVAVTAKNTCHITVVWDFWMLTGSLAPLVPPDRTTTSHWFSLSTIV